MISDALYLALIDLIKCGLLLYIAITVQEINMNTYCIRFPEKDK